VLEAVLLLEEAITPGLLAGMVLVASGLYLTNRPR
jgi:drug/metabolite transporter (DMT)-like permease